MTGSGNISLDVHATGPIKNTQCDELQRNRCPAERCHKDTFADPARQRKNATIQFTQNSANLTNFAASLGSTNANGNISIANFDAPNLRFALNIDKVNVAELQKITGASAPPAKKTAANWRLHPQC